MWSAEWSSGGVRRIFQLVRRFGWCAESAVLSSGFFAASARFVRRGSFGMAAVPSVGVRPSGFCRDGGVSSVGVRRGSSCGEATLRSVEGVLSDSRIRLPRESWSVIFRQRCSCSSRRANLRRAFGAAGRRWSVVTLQRASPECYFLFFRPIE